MYALFTMVHQACSFLQCHHLQRMSHWLLAHPDCEWHGPLTHQMDWFQTILSMWPDWKGGVQWSTTHLETLSYCSLMSPTLTHMSWWRLVCQPATVQERDQGAQEWEEGPEKNVSQGCLSLYSRYAGRCIRYYSDLYVQPQALWTTAHQGGAIWLMPSRLPGLLQRDPMGWSCNIISSSQAMMAEQSLLLTAWGVLL